MTIRSLREPSTGFFFRPPSPELDRALRQRAEVPALDDGARGLVLRRRAERHEDRREVLVRGKSFADPGCLRAVVEERSDVAPAEDLGRPGVELCGPGRRDGLAAPIERAQ